MMIKETKLSDKLNFNNLSIQLYQVNLRGAKQETTRKNHDLNRNTFTNEGTGPLENENYERKEHLN